MVVLLNLWSWLFLVSSRECEAKVSFEVVELNHELLAFEAAKRRAEKACSEQLYWLEDEGMWLAAQKACLVKKHLACLVLPLDGISY